MRQQRKSTCLLLFLALIATACGGGGATSSDGEDGGSFEDVTLRIGSSSIPDFTDVALVRLYDQLEEHGIQVEVSHFEGDQGPLRALVAGEIDIAAAGIPATIHLSEQTDQGVKAFAVNLAATDYVLVSQPEITELDSLAGKRLGIAGPGGISDVLTRLVLGAEGIDVNTVNFVSVGGSTARMSALSSGQIDAGPAHAALALTAAEKGLNRLWLYADTVQNYLQQGLISTDTWLSENGELAQLVVDEMIEASRWASENKQEYIALSNEAVEGPSESVRDEAYEIFKEIGMFAVNGGMSEEQRSATAEIEVQLGNIAKAPSLDTWSDSSYVEDYLERKGE